jgi:DNA-binding winged helix-turn-helix (wHTH) protein/dienelactone hydrolase
MRRWIADETPMSATLGGTPIELANEPDFTLGDLHVRPSTREVSSESATEILEPRVMQVLVALGRRRSEVVSRDWLVNQCWSGRIVGDDAISRCVARIRRLAEAHGGFTVETIARVGYRLSEHATTAPALAPPVAPRSPVSGRWRMSSGAIFALALFVGVSVGVWVWQSDVTTRDGEATVLAQVGDLVSQDRYGAAYARALPLIRNGHRGTQPRLRELWAKIVVPMRPLVAESGATVYFKPYDDPLSEWIGAGVTPLRKSVDAPRGPLRLKVTKPGFRTGYFVVANPGPSLQTDEPPAPGLASDPVPLPLASADALPDDMVRVPATDLPVFVRGWSRDLMGSDRHAVAAFNIQRSEVTNQEFKEFVDAGGYEDSRFWQELKFKEGNRELSWAQVRLRLVDATGRPGPASWQFGTYPRGTAPLPVGGISWYEAVAYARFRDASLPTIHHWARAAMSPYDAWFMTSSAITSRSRVAADGPVPAHEEWGLGPWGTYSMFGNAREWVWNSSGNNGLLMGGAWSDYDPASSMLHTAPPLQRLPEYGLRLMRESPGQVADESLRAPVAIDVVEYERKPVSDEVFAAMQFQFTIQHARPREAKVVTVEETPLWVAEEVVLRYAAQDTATLYVVRPRSHGKPLQPILYGPAGDCCAVWRPNRAVLEQLRTMQFVVDGGRALVLPIWTESYERFMPYSADASIRADRERSLPVRWQQELSSAIDYLASRDDMDIARIGYFGVSKGANQNGALNLALEPRVHAAVWVSGGLFPDVSNVHPMMDILNYAPRIRIPVLMINGRFDHIYPYERSQKRLFELLGAPADRKSLRLFDVGHFAYPPHAVAIAATDWLDQYLGPVR